MVAECRHHKKMPKESACKCSRTVEPSDAPRRQTQGRPVGELVAWLIYGGGCTNRHNHVHAWAPTMQQKLEARRYSKHLANSGDDYAKDLFRAERPKKFIDEDSEPDT